MSSFDQLQSKILRTFVRLIVIIGGFYTENDFKKSQKDIG